ncbi:MAG: 50S ribosomal protein L28 [Candidatus Kerfeldbacteria bacterium]|nr:50S ribosomal protein L28 [Candidatus Kerfeldbacteria bacterium]
MAQVCQICGRGSLKGNRRSHSNIATIKRQKVNLQSLLIGVKRVRACTSCIRTAAKQRTLAQEARA